MNTKLNIEERRKKLREKYKYLLEEAYNFRQTDSAMSDFYEFSALKLLNEINQLQYLNRDPIAPLDL